MKKSYLASLAACTVLTALALPAFAADAEQAADQSEAGASQPSGIADIIVVARRRAESLQKVPVAVTAVSGDALQAQNVTTMLDLQRVSPGLSAQPSGGVSRNLPLYSIRGQQQGEFLASSDPSVGIYWGDILVQRAYGSDLNIFDLQQVEVLKGPQGTLFGRNTTGGNIIFRSNTPTDKLEGGAYLQTGSYSLVNAQAYVNLPLGEGIALRLAGNYKYQDGYIRNVYDGPISRVNLGTQDGDYFKPVFSTSAGSPNARYGGERGAGLRASLKIESGAFTNLTVGTYTTRNTMGSGYRLLAVQPPATFLIGLLGAENEVATSLALPWNQIRAQRDSYTKMPYSWAVANTTSYDLTDSITLKNTFGYHRYKASNFEDVDGSALPIMAYGTILKGWELNDELQIAGSGDGFNWIAGLYYFRERAFSNAFGTDTLGFFVPTTPTSGPEMDLNSSKSIFGSVTKELIEGVSLTAGGRYTWDKRAVRFGTFNNVSTPIQSCGLDPSSATYTQFNAVFDPVECSMSESHNFKKFTYTVSLDWQIAPNKLIYAAHRKGYRSGGFNTRGTDPNGYGIFLPEDVKDVEVGFKGDFHITPEVQLRTNIAAYYQWYKNIQRLITFAPCLACQNQTVVFNPASATIYGGEFESELQIGKWLNLNGSIAIVRPKYKSFNFQGTDYADTATFGGLVRNQFSVGGRLTLPTPESFADTSLQVNWYHQSSFFNQNDLASPAPARIPAYSVTNARLEFAKVGGTELTVGVSVNNVFNKHYLSNIYSLYNQVGFTSGQYALPRTWAVDMRFAF